MGTRAQNEIGLLICCCACAAIAGERESFTLQKYPSGHETYLRLAEKIETHLKDEILAKWFPACIDAEHGGFHARFNEEFKPEKDDTRALVYQGRMTWVSAQIAMRYPAMAATYKGYVRHGVKFLRDVMWDAECGGLFFLLNADGKLGVVGGEKHAYGIAFGMYALAAAYRATGDPDALELAQRTFKWFDKHAHDGDNGGYFEALTREGQPILSPPSPQKTRDLIWTQYGYKSMNSHIHLLEALTELHAAWPDGKVEDRLEEVFRIVRDKIVVPPGCMNLYFTPDWRAVPDHDSFGHDVETAFLLIEAAEALGKKHDEKTLAVARSLVDHALDFGWDKENGGFFDKGSAFGAAYGLEKIWWTQAEGLNALLLMHENFGKETPRYFEAFLKQWEFIWNFQADHRNGEWYEMVSREGVATPGKAKGQNWKAAYHNGRALLNTSRMLKEMDK
ncbi:MAG TPA: AGE family epimerase/isomerase [Planctomycetota bacterium]|jgi:mannobiose 2-epimerase